MKNEVLFIQGGGEGAYDADALLAASLQDALGSSWVVHYPRMPGEDTARYEDWRRRIAAELRSVQEPVILVGHSVGGAILLKYLSEEQVAKPIAGLFLVATPFVGGPAGWDYVPLQLRPDFSAKLRGIPRIVLYHNRDDETVPFAHLAEYAARLPQATIRVADRGGHQFENDLSRVAADIVTVRT